MHRAMEYRVPDSEYHPSSFRDQGANQTKLHRHEPADHITRCQFREMVSAPATGLTFCIKPDTRPISTTCVSLSTATSKSSSIWTKNPYVSQAKNNK
jgi:hypothetical protein